MVTRKATGTKPPRKPKRPRNPVARALFSPALKPKVVAPKGAKGAYTRKGRRTRNTEEGSE